MQNNGNQKTYFIYVRSTGEKVPVTKEQHNSFYKEADRIADADAALDSLEQQKQAAEVEIAKPFAQEEELQTKSARLAELDALLNMEHQSSRTEPEAEEKPDARPSVLAALEEKADKVEPVRPFKSYLDKDGDAR